MTTVIRRNMEILCQDYRIQIGRDRFWNMIYSSFSYPSEQDRGEMGVDESLIVLGGGVENTISLRGGEVTMNLETGFGCSPVLDELERMGDDIKDWTIGNLSPEARRLLERGLDYYINVK